MARTLLDMGARAEYCSRAVCGSNSAVECHPAKVDVAGSNPVSRSPTQKNGEFANNERAVSRFGAMNRVSAVALSTRRQSSRARERTSPRAPRSCRARAAVHGVIRP